jgi:DNA-binding Xre family transcriptional regulator
VHIVSLLVTVDNHKNERLKGQLKMTTRSKATKAHQSNSLCFHLRDIAEAQGFTPTTLARAAGVHPQTVRAYWKNPSRNIRLKMLTKLARALNVSVTQLVEEVQ